MCQTGASRTPFPSVCPPWLRCPGPLPSLFVPSTAGDTRLPPGAQQATFRGHLMPRGGAWLGSPEAQVTPRGHRRKQRGTVGRLQVLLAAEGHDTSAPTLCSKSHRLWPSSFLRPQPRDPPPQGSGSLPRPLWGGRSQRQVGRGLRLKECCCGFVFPPTPPAAHSLRFHRTSPTGLLCAGKRQVRWTTQRPFQRMAWSCKLDVRYTLMLTH